MSEVSPEFIRLERDLAVVRTELEITSTTQEQLQTQVEELTTRLQDAQLAHATSQATLESLQTQLETAEKTLVERMASAEELQARVTEQEGELGELRTRAALIEPIQEELATVRGDRDRLVAQVAQLETAHGKEIAELEARIPVEVRAAVSEARREYDQTAATWAGERKILEDRITELEAAQAEVPEGRAVAADDLAAQFRSVVDDLSRPSAVSGAALTALEVEARGVYAPPAEGGTVPRIVAPDPGTGEPGALTTVRMRFGLVPQIAPTEPPGE